MRGKSVCKKRKGGGKETKCKMQRMETKDYSVKETKGEQRGVDKVGGEQRRSVSFIAHSRPLREGLTSQGLRGSGQAVGHQACLAICCRSKPRHIAARRSLQHRTLCKLFVLCQVTPYLTRTASRGVTCANGFGPVPAHSCATDGCGVSTRAFCTASFQR